MDHLFCFKLKHRVDGQKRSLEDIKEEQKKEAEAARRYALTIFETISVYLSLSISSLFFSYWAFTNQPEYVLISFLFFVMSFIYFVSSFWRKVTMLHLKRKFIEKNNANKHFKTHNSHVSYYQILLLIDTLWFSFFIVTSFGICLNLPEVFNNPDRPDFCL